MAKGFTVKASKPKTKKAEADWDYDAIKQRMRGKAIVFCFYSKSFCHEIMLSISVILYQFI